MDFNAIKINNNFNFFKQNQQDYTSHKTLVYDIKDFTCFPENIDYTVNSDNYRIKILSEYLEKLNNKQELRCIYISQVIITNIGNEIVEGKDFLGSSKLRIHNCDYYLGFINTNFTKDYIGAKIVNHKEYDYIIDFDCLKPNDSIVISFVTDKESASSYTQIFGETKYFNSILSQQEFNEYSYKLKIQKNFKIKILSIIVSIVTIIFLLAFCMLCEKRYEIKLVIKKLPQVNEVQHAK